MANLKLYNFTFSPFARKVRIAMAEKGVSCEKVTVDLMSGAHKKPDYLQINPHGKVPTLVVDGTPLYESTAIIEYLEEAFPNPPLLPKDPIKRARARMIEETVDGSFVGAVATVFQNTRIKPEAERDPKAVESARTQIAWYNEWLNKELEGRQYLADGAVSVADIAALCVLEFQGMLGIPIESRNKSLIAWHERMKARPSAKALME